VQGLVRHFRHEIEEKIAAYRTAQQQQEQLLRSASA